MTLQPEQIGDRGQRYEVRYADETTPFGDFKVVGWSSTASGANKLAAAWRLRPSVENVWVADRHEDRSESS